MSTIIKRRCQKAFKRTLGAAGSPLSYLCHSHSHPLADDRLSRSTVCVTTSYLTACLVCTPAIFGVSSTDSFKVSPKSTDLEKFNLFLTCLCLESRGTSGYVRGPRSLTGMCGRARCSLSREELRAQARVERWSNEAAYEPSYNVSPSRSTPVLKQGTANEERELHTMK